MLIRCERCEALYSLQEGIVRGVESSVAVECGRCLHRFNAKIVRPVPLRKGAPKQAAETKTQPHQEAAQAAPRGKASQSAERSAGAAESGEELAKSMRPRRPAKADARDLNPAPRNRTRALFGVAGALVLVVAASSAWLFLHHRSLPAAAAAKLDRARVKLLLDDDQSLEQAVSLFSDAARLAPGEAGPEGERAFALLMLAGAREPQLRDGPRLAAEGLAAAKAALAEAAEEPAALRAMALYYAQTNATDRGNEYADRAAQSEAAPPRTAFDAYVRAALAQAGAPSKDKQERALSALAVARSAEPNFIRALYETAVIEANRQELAPARETLHRILEMNPRHERAAHLLAQLPAPQ